MAWKVIEGHIKALWYFMYCLDLILLKLFKNEKNKYAYSVRNALWPQKWFWIRSLLDFPEISFAIKGQFEHYDLLPLLKSWFMFLLKTFVHV
jgi:hypothetical protein